MAYKKDLAARVKRVEAKVAARKPETKVYTSLLQGTSGTLNNYTLDFKELGGIVEGTGYNERIGSKIRVHKIEVWGSSDNTFGIIVLKSKLAVDPVLADFEGTTCATLTGKLVNNAYVILHQEFAKHMNQTETGIVRFVKTFKAGIPVSYEDPTTGSCSHNNLYFCAVNNTASAGNLDLRFRVFYTDC